MECATVIGGILNMHKEADVKSDRITTIPSGASVAVIENGGEWCKVAHSTYTGYVMTKYLQFDCECNDTITISVSNGTAKELYTSLRLAFEE